MISRDNGYSECKNDLCLVTECMGYSSSAWPVYHNIITFFYLKKVNHQQKYTQSKSEGALLITDIL